VPVQPDFLTPHILSTPTPGGLVLRAAAGLPEPARCVGDWLVRWAGERPEATFLAERGADGSWARVTYAEALAVVEALGSSLLALGGRPDRPVMILSDNSVDGALLSLAACHVGIPVSPVSPAYSLLSQSFDRLRDVASQLRPGFVFADEPERFGGALRAMGSPGARGRHGARLERRRRSPRARRAGAERAAGRMSAVGGAGTGVREGGAGHDRQGALHVGVDGPAEGRREHAADADGQSGEHGGVLAVPGQGGSGGRRLAALEPHVRRQPQLLHGAPQRREPVPRPRAGRRRASWRRR
jgi:hypothetical protein